MIGKQNERNEYRNKKHNIAKILIVTIIVITFLVINGYWLLDMANANDLSLYDSEYTYCKQNDDGTYSLYIYNSPIQYWDNDEYKKIDNTLVLQSGKYKYTNKDNEIKMNYPKNFKDSFVLKDNEKQLKFKFMDDGNWEEAVLEDWNNINGDRVKAVVYKNSITNKKFAMYSSNLGIQVEYVSDEKNTKLPKLKVEGEFSTVQDEGNGYILYENRSKKNFIIYNSIVKQDNQIKLSNMMKVLNISNNESEIQLLSNNNQVVHFSIEFYKKSIPDSAVYSEYKVNNYLSNLAVVGVNDMVGKGILDMRFRVCYYLTANKNNVLNANYNIKYLEHKQKTENLKLKKCTTQWRSSTILWESQPKIEGYLLASSIDKDKNTLSFDITEFIKECVEDFSCYTEGFGCALVAEKTDYAIVATADNSEYISYLEIKFKELPAFYNPDTNN